MVSKDLNEDIQKLQEQINNSKSHQCSIINEICYKYKFKPRVAVNMLVFKEKNKFF
ncbi:hypothetical protein HYX11_04415 [Candidatus Woesearchaeota archaeon]|nr:hypothetical protein [Candidatus Woesearchaeota archaeon]